MIKKALTTYDIAKYCDVSPRTVAQWISEGKIKAFRTPGNHNRVKEDDFLVFLKEHNIPIPENFVSPNHDNLKKKILIVDDDKNMANSIKRVLAIGDNYEIDIARDGFDAGRKLMLFRPDIVLLDIRMPGMDGYEVARRIREVPENANVKIIAISAFFEDDGKERIILLGADCCLDKPFNEEILLEKISFLSKKG
ncbi:MAG: response regulator [Candidatus Omnitrophica bacterium]|nr:response regulator [Candidatus Omnitrophota bacterium]MBU1997238.1 response regulator [Candidatus Omnitrophota bacterium]MBU4333628.1 response regulator [Candidatus Omnitrophota bacterium]